MTEIQHLGTHVALCAERYKAVDDRLRRIEKLLVVLMAFAALMHISGLDSLLAVIR